jgi:RHS repeat-associated protein
MNNNGVGTSTIIARHDYLPFGAEISSGTGLRTPTQGYGAMDTNRQKYGLTERDDATGLDHTWWRKYESFSGRMTTPDPYGGSASVADPQSFNRYSYVQNDPVNFVDPTGLDWYLGDCHTVTWWYDGWHTQEICFAVWKDPNPNGSGGGPDGGHGGGGGSHEFAHKRLPCPPTGKQLAKNPVIKNALEEAFKLSNEQKLERGGWIYWNPRTGKVATLLKTPNTDQTNPRRDTWFQIDLNNPPSPQKGWYIIGDYHTHSEGPSPDPYDIDNENARKVPGIVIDPGGLHPYGPNRGIWYKDLPANCR